MTVTLEQCRAALASPRVRAFLRVIREGESSQDDSAYTVMFGGQHFTAPPWVHPRQINEAAGLRSSAAGAYQFLSGTWGDCQQALNLPDFSPESQDLAAIWLIGRAGALDDVLEGRLAVAVNRCANVWASLPGSPYGQPTLDYERVSRVYAEWLNRYQAEAVAPATQPAAPIIEAGRPLEKPMTPLLPIFGPLIA